VGRSDKEKRKKKRERRSEAKKKGEERIGDNSLDRVGWWDEVIKKR
jgi:hypothetical protein